jgi:hypothetical protein
MSGKYNQTMLLIMMSAFAFIAHAAASNRMSEIESRVIQLESQIEFLEMRVK